MTTKYNSEIAFSLCNLICVWQRQECRRLRRAGFCQCRAAVCSQLSSLPCNADQLPMFRCVAGTILDSKVHIAGCSDTILCLCVEPTASQSFVTHLYSSFLPIFLFLLLYLSILLFFKVTSSPAFLSSSRSPALA